MPHLKSAAKHLRHSRKKAAENKKIKKRLKETIKNAGGPKDLPALSKAIDKAVKRGLIHKNRAARMKSSLAQKLGGRPQAKKKAA